MTGPSFDDLMEGASPGRGGTAPAGARPARRRRATARAAAEPRGGAGDPARAPSATPAGADDGAAPPARRRAGRRGGHRRGGLLRRLPRRQRGLERHDDVVSIPMRPTAVAPQTAAAVIALEKNGSESNVPMTLTVSGLKKLPKGGYYELWLTREVKSGGGTKQKLLVSCGTFLQSSDRRRGEDERPLYAREPARLGDHAARPRSHDPADRADDVATEPFARWR